MSKPKKKVKITAHGVYNNKKGQYCPYNELVMSFESAVDFNHSMMDPRPIFGWVLLSCPLCKKIRVRLPHHYESCVLRPQENKFKRRYHSRNKHNFTHPDKSNKSLGFLWGLCVNPDCLGTFTFVGFCFKTIATYDSETRVTVTNGR